MSEHAWQNRIVGEGLEDPNQVLANPFNWRKHPEYQKKALRGALDEVGWVQRTIINRRTGHLIDGHLRIELAMEDNESQVPVLYVDLSEEEERVALASLDSITGLAETDQDMIDQVVASIDVQDFHLDAFLQSLASGFDPNEEQEGETDPDDIPEPQPDPVTRRGDVWVLGDHRLMCGDATSQGEIETLCDGTPIDMVWTDPPYNVNYEGGTGKTIQNDHMANNQFRAFLRDSLSAACAVTREGGPVYVAHADSEGLNFRAALIEAGFLYKQCLIWVKSSMVLGRQDYQWQHEPVLYGWKPGAAHKWYGEFNKKTVIDDEPDLRAMDKSELVNECRRLRNAMNASVVRADKPSKNGEHPTMKPVALITHMMKNSSTPGNAILDPFAGSGSTIIAAERTGRAARTMELDPIYCDVTIRRYQEYTGKEAALLNTGETFRTREQEAK